MFTSPALSAASFQFLHVSNTLKCPAPATLLHLHLSMPLKSVALQVSITNSHHHPLIFSPYVHVSSVFSRMSSALSASITLVPHVFGSSRFKNFQHFHKFPTLSRLLHPFFLSSLASKSTSNFQHQHVFNIFTSFNTF